jgi:hypothetical protein
MVLADGLEHLQHLALVVEGAVFALQESQEDVGDEHFNFSLQMIFESIQ